MKYEILLLASPMYSGSNFMFQLLNAHSQIQAYYWNQLATKFHKDYSDIFSYLLDYQFPERLYRELEVKSGWICIYNHIFNMLPLSWLMFQPFKVKLISTIRHPYRILRTSFLRAKEKGFCTTNPNLGLWGMLLPAYFAMNLDSDLVRCIPVDLLAESEEHERITYISDILSWLELEPEEEVLDSAMEWKKVGAFTGNAELDEETEFLIRRVVRESRILDLYRKIGLNYAESIDA